MVRRLVALGFAGTMLLAIPAPASAVPTCPRGAFLIPWAPTVSPDRNENGFACVRNVGSDGTITIFTDDRDV